MVSYHSNMATDPEIVRLELGFDRFEAQIIQEACRAQELTVEVLFMDEGGNAPGRTALEPHLLLVRTDEVEQARQIIARSQT